MKTIVVTGGSRGIGFGLAREFLARGHNVVLTGRTRQAAEQSAASLAHAATGGAHALGAACEVTDLAQVQAVWDRASSEFGAVDIWINNAGISHPREPVGELSPADITRVEETNLLGMMYCCRVALTGMQRQGSGAIYNMEGYGSNGMTMPGMSLYGASKFGLTYFTQCLIAETRGTPILVCYLSPGIVLTDLTLRDMAARTPAEWERTRRIYNILGDKVETVTPWLAERVLANRKSGARIAWLTPGKSMRRFLTARFNKRDVFPAQRPGG